MFKQFSRRRPSPAMVVAVIALVAACAGSATAATVITGKQIRNNSVTGKDIRDGSLRGVDIRNRSIRGEDLARGILRPLESGARQASRAAGPRNVPAGRFAVVAALTGLEPAAYVVLAKVDLGSNAVTGSQCRLAATSGVTDASGRGLRAGGTAEAHNLQLITTFSAPGAVGLECRSDAGNWSATNTKITAIRVGNAQNVDLPQ